jgi:hypothetical protein
MSYLKKVSVRGRLKIVCCEKTNINHLIIHFTLVTKGGLRKSEMCKCKTLDMFLWIWKIYPAGYMCVNAFLGLTDL